MRSNNIESRNKKYTQDLTRLWAEAARRIFAPDHRVGVEKRRANRTCTNLQLNINSCYVFSMWCCGLEYLLHKSSLRPPRTPLTQITTEPAGPPFEVLWGGTNCIVVFPRLISSTL